MTATRSVRVAERPARRTGVASPFLFTLRTKGAAGLAGRLVTVTSRFGPTPRLMVSRLDRMLDTAVAAGLRPTCPITATVLARHPASIRSLSERGMEFAVHGLRHNDHLAQDDVTQAREVAQAMSVFARCGIEPRGFRAPYLRANEDTARAVRAAGLLYQSDDAVFFPIDDVRPDAMDDDGYRRAITMYDAQSSLTVASRPTIAAGLVRIPVCVPDDEMVVDRLHLDDDVCARIWSGILRATHEQGDLFTMQIHPERFVESMSAVNEVLSLAAGLPGTVWGARLDEIAEWWIARSVCSIEIGPARDGQVAFALTGDPRARMRLVGGLGTERTEREPTRHIVLPVDPMPAVGIGPDVPQSVVRFLAEDGYLLTSTPALHCAVRLGPETRADDQIALRRRILSADHPVLAIDRWPDGARSALALTGDVDALTMQDFMHRVRENAHGVPASITAARP